VKVSRSLDYCTPGETPYTVAWAWQRQRLQQMQQIDLPDGLLLLTHPPVYTLGQGADPSFLKFDPPTAGFEIYRVERGGEVTYHGPGQWVGYPLLDLRRHQQDLHWYLRQLEQVLIDVLAYFGLMAERVAGLTGVWVEGYKLGAIGIRATRWITWHGFALNVCPDLAAFEAIVPCGIADRPVGSLAQFLPGITMAEVQPAIVQAFGDRFHRAPQPVSLSEWLGETETSNSRLLQERPDPEALGREGDRS
jgi:lipoyl(octanoyl) transferase